MDSAAGKGSTFSLILPLDKAYNNDNNNEKKEAAAAGEPPREEGG